MFYQPLSVHDIHNTFN